MFLFIYIIELQQRSQTTFDAQAKPKRRAFLLFLESYTQMVLTTAPREKNLSCVAYQGNNCASTSPMQFSSLSTSDKPSMYVVAVVCVRLILILVQRTFKWRIVFRAQATRGGDTTPKQKRRLPVPPPTPSLSHSLLTFYYNRLRIGGKKGQQPTSHSTLPYPIQWRIWAK